MRQRDACDDVELCIACMYKSGLQDSQRTLALVLQLGHQMPQVWQGTGDSPAAREPGKLVGPLQFAHWVLNGSRIGSYSQSPALSSNRPQAQACSLPRGAQHPGPVDASIPSFGSSVLVCPNALRRCQVVPTLYLKTGHRAVAQLLPCRRPGSRTRYAQNDSSAPVSGMLQQVPLRKPG